MDEPILIWDLDDDPDGNLQHIAEHGLTPGEVASVFADLDHEVLTSRTSGLPLVRGVTNTGRYVIVVYEHVGDDPLTIYPVTAYEPDPDG